MGEDGHVCGVPFLPASQKSNEAAFRKAEKATGRPVDPPEIVHPKGGQKERNWPCPDQAEIEPGKEGEHFCIFKINAKMWDSFSECHLGGER